MDAPDPGARGRAPTAWLSAAIWLGLAGAAPVHAGTASAPVAFDTPVEAMKHPLPRPRECAETIETACVPTFSVDVSLDGRPVSWRASRWEWASSPGRCLDEHAVHWTDCVGAAPGAYRIDRRLMSLMVAPIGRGPPSWPTAKEALAHAPAPPAAGCVGADGAGLCTPAFTVAGPTGKPGMEWRVSRWVSTASPGLCSDAQPGGEPFPCSRPGPGAWRVDMTSLSRPIPVGPVAYDTPAKAKRHLLPVSARCRDPAGALICIPSFFTEKAPGSSPGSVMWRPSLWVPPNEWGECADDQGQNWTKCQEPPAGFERIQPPAPPPPPPLFIKPVKTGR